MLRFYVRYGLGNSPPVVVGDKVGMSGNAVCGPPQTFFELKGTTLKELDESFPNSLSPMLLSSRSSQL